MSDSPGAADAVRRALTAVVVGLLVASGAPLVLGSGSDPAAASPYAELARASAPTRLIVPSLHVNAPVVPIQVTPEASLDPPANPSEVGWWQRSARVGAPSGQTVITGHTVHTGGGQLDHLGSIAHGARLRVVTRAGTVVYRATRTVVYTKAQLSAHAVELFAQGRRANRLVLITCTGWTGHDYTSNVVVFAVPLGVRTPSTTATAASR